MGFGAGWLAFGSSIERADPAADLERRLLQRERSVGRDADNASCEPRQATSAQFLCTVVYGLSAGTAADAATFVASLDGERVTFRRRPAF